MSELRKAEATAGLMAHILFSATAAVLFLVGALAINYVPAFDGSPLRNALDDGRALPVYYYSAMVLLAGAAIWVAWEMGRTSARTGNPVGRDAAMGVLLGALVAWVNIIIAMLFVSSITQGSVDGAVDLALEGLVFLVVGIVPVMLVAAFAATFARDHYAMLPGLGLPVTADDVRTATDDSWSGLAEKTGAHLGTTAVPVMAEPAAVHIDCVRCATPFSVAGPRPLRISCPACGKSGTLR